MKSIVVATDFSPAAENATRYAIELAGILKTKLVLLNILEPAPAYAVEVLPAMAVEDEMEACRQKLEEKTQAIGKETGLEVEYYCNFGSPGGLLVEESLKREAQYIIAGMGTRGKGIRKLFGNTITELVQHSNVPILVIPENASFKTIAKMALAYERDLSFDADTRLLEPLTYLGDTFKSKLQLVHVYRDVVEHLNDRFNDRTRIERFTRHLQPETTNLYGTSVTAELEIFIHEQHIDLVAMLIQKHSFLARLFTKSQTRRMIFETDIPLLLIPDKRSGELYYDEDEALLL